VSEIQHLLDDDTLLLEYFLGEERSYLWVVSRTSVIDVVFIPKRSDIESAAKAFYESISRPPSASGDGRSRTTRGKNAGPSDESRAAALSQMLLGPVADRLGTKRLLIVGDGILHYLPFGALPVPAQQTTIEQKSLRAGQRTSAPYLIEQHEIVYVPSASVLAVLRSQTDDVKPAPLSVVVLADPVFGLDDDRLKTTKQITQSAGVHAQNVATPQGPNAGEHKTRSGLDLVRLSGTIREAEAIHDAIPTPGTTKIATGFEASRATVMKLQNEAYRIVHFATHGDLDTEHPELSSIVLSLRDADGRPQDGFLRLHDIYNLKLPADMIVLSACSTGLGSVIRGEGLVGLTRGFMHAGSPRVVASLWRVEDLSTSELMSRFYQHIAKDGMAPSLALRQAQVDMLRRKSQRSPYHWAGFVLQGEWRAIR